ncbi:MAG: VOC family protein [Bosea sp.]|uniref:VOC family protein n=1 Tax=Bosea sp. (in: a-proteobacteria) TaxID=1871050 RepID=UPI002394E0E8|nr:VOC family protein [Bosea sp. (in: a-proteobacteria)]MCP4735027.1 VOC family protein [Bosea sp. (in: a-proteobacteria)]
MAERLQPFLMFEGRAEEALNFYISLIPDSRIESIMRYGPQGPGPEGSVMAANATIGGLPVMVSDSYVKHAFSFTPSLSLFLNCTGDEEIERLSAALAEGGGVLMPLDNYGFSRRFAWVNDRFGVSWQLNLP